MGGERSICSGGGVGVRAHGGRVLFVLDELGPDQFQTAFGLGIADGVFANPVTSFSHKGGQSGGDYGFWIGCKGVACGTNRRRGGKRWVDLVEGGNRQIVCVG